MNTRLGCAILGFAALVLPPTASAGPVISFASTSPAGQFCTPPGQLPGRRLCPPGESCAFGQDLPIDQFAAAGTPFWNHLLAGISGGLMDFDTTPGGRSVSLTGLLNGTIPIVVTGAVTGSSYHSDAATGTYGSDFWGVLTINDEFAAYLGFAPGTPFDFTGHVYGGQWYAKYWSYATDYGLEAMAPVPEPASLLLFGTGLAGIAGRAWRRRRRV